METARRQWIYAWLMLSPAMALLILFTHYPAVQTIVNSFYSTPRGRRKAVWIGLDNYQTLILDDVFWKVLMNNFWYAVWTIPLSILLSLAMALWVNDKIRGRGFLRMAYFTPTVLPLIAVANIWLFFYTPGFGLIDQIRGLFGLAEQNWMGSPDTALYSMIAVAIWKEAGFFMIFYLAALQTIPPSLREAADIEGASRWYYFRRVLFPLLMPTTLFVSINAVINSFRLVDHIFVMTEGGPNNASSLLLFYIYEVAFDYWDTAYAATLTVVMIAILILLAIGQFFLFDRKVHYK
ncbi:Lactose transport system permease protein LacF [Pelagimonas phthalicica]|uniref:Lactose transport system permease protein LacF n=1 Tax=Pelagimonas phthalicica TaxID=1037362 RepID=A0A238JA11_9RHOB|nr:sugar ABC transporter permease [Pelagimonas phthalicica]TDS93926.1 carbohydrate ABC transporter membrane protein 1 (CUT1 family) [Pelagimonas phthalicica]SMX27550.1 Lactose transport system permease protein LacF [Pelagimonas phthalicica]